MQRGMSPQFAILVHYQGKCFRFCYSGTDTLTNVRDSRENYYKMCFRKIFKFLNSPWWSPILLEDDGKGVYVDGGLPPCTSPLCDI